jgi:hypothetical protein
MRLHEPSVAGRCGGSWHAGIRHYISIAIIFGNEQKGGEGD